MDWITHEEDVWFEFRGSRPEQLKPGRFYKGTVDGYADFGVFIDLTDGVTGLLHRSELDRRLESLEWEPGDEVFVQVKNVRDNGNIDLAWSIRQSESEFRGARIHDPDGDADGDPIESEDRPKAIKQRPTSSSNRTNVARNGSKREDSDASGDDTSQEAADGSESATASESPQESAGGESGASTGPRDGESGGEGSRESSGGGQVAAAPQSTGGLADEPEPAGDRERVTVASLSDRVGDEVRIEGEVVSARQTGGPTVFEVRDETGVVDCAAFVEAGVRAYPDIEEGDRVRLDGEVEIRRDELQIETSALVALSEEDAAAVDDRVSAALRSRARPETVVTLTDHEGVQAVTDQLQDAAETVRRAVFEDRPIVVRHTATTDGYVAGAALERAVLPLIRAEHERSDAEYHYFTRRPLESAVYDMDAATNDVTRMLQGQDRFDEKLPLVVLLGTGSTVESQDGLGLLGVYGAQRLVVDAAPADDEIVEDAEALVNPGLAGADADDLTNGAIAATLAATVNDAVRGDLSHIPAVSYWDGVPAAYEALAADAGFDAERVRELREAIALEAYYQSYEDKRELITDLLFEDGGAADSKREGGEAAAGNLARHVSNQFREKMAAEVETAEANLEAEGRAGVRFGVLDADAYTHRFDFPPTPLLADELYRRHQEKAPFVVVALKMDELYVRGPDEVSVRAVAERAAELAPEAGIAAAGVREGRIEFLAGARDDVRDAVVEAVTAQF